MSNKLTVEVLLPIVQGLLASGCYVNKGTGEGPIVDQTDLVADAISIWSEVADQVNDRNEMGIGD